MARLFDQLSQYTLRLTKHCELNCLGCPLKDAAQTNRKPTRQIAKWIEDGQFFEKFPRKRLYNVIGGDPIVHPDLPVILRYLKSQGIYTRVWTHGIYTAEQLRPAIASSDQLMITLPTVNPASYREQTGVDGFGQLQATLEYLKEIQKQVGLNCKVTPQNLGVLPDIYGMAFQYKLPLWVHYSPTEAFTREAIAYFKRFRRIKNVWVFEAMGAPKSRCPWFPHIAIENKRQIVQNFIDELLNGVRFKFSL